MTPEAIEQATNELFAYSVDRVAYERALLQQLAARRGLSNFEAALLQVLDAELSRADIETVADLLLKSTQELSAATS